MKNVKSLLQSNIGAKIAEIFIVFFIAILIIWFFVDMDNQDRLIYNQLVIWIANVVMLILVWLGIKLRNEQWESLGLKFSMPSLSELGKIFIKSIIVFIAGLSGFVLGSIIMANITGIPEKADMSNYAFLENNPGMLILTLLGVYIVSSIGEEVIYRGFLLNRIAQIWRNPKKAKWIAITLSSIIFGFAHYSWGPMGIVQTGLMGFALAICYYAFKRNLWILILAHAYMDTILMVQMYLGIN